MFFAEKTIKDHCFREGLSSTFSYTFYGLWLLGLMLKYNMQPYTIPQKHISLGLEG